MFGFMQSTAPSVAYDPFHAVKMAETGDITVIDIREHAEVQASGKAKGAIHVPLAALRMKADPASPEQLPEFRNGKPVVIYCQTGSRSGFAVRMLRQQGYRRVLDMKGISNHRALGLQTAR